MMTVKLTLTLRQAYALFSAAEHCLHPPMNCRTDMQRKELEILHAAGGKLLAAVKRQGRCVICGEEIPKRRKPGAKPHVCWWDRPPTVPPARAAQIAKIHAEKEFGYADRP